MRVQPHLVAELVAQPHTLIRSACRQEESSCIRRLLRGEPPGLNRAERVVVAITDAFRLFAEVDLLHAVQIDVQKCGVAASAGLGVFRSTPIRQHRRRLVPRT